MWWGIGIVRAASSTRGLSTKATAFLPNGCCKSTSCFPTCTARRTHRRRGTSVDEKARKHSKQSGCWRPPVVVRSNTVRFSTTPSSSPSPAPSEIDSEQFDERGGENSAAASAETQAAAVAVTPLIDPFIAFNGTIPYPKSLSPSSASEFLACPQSYMFQYLLGMKQPTNLALAKGSMCHSALEKIFDLRPEQRTLENLQNFLRVSWSEAREKDGYRDLFRVGDGEEERGEETIHVRDVDAERRWGMEALHLLENYVKVEDPSTVLPPNPVRREMWLNVNLTVDPTRGVTWRGRSGGDDDDRDESREVAETSPKFLVRGIVDRVDLIRCQDDGQLSLRIVDYKTGKAPAFKYTPQVNERIASEVFWQLKVYALLVREMTSGWGNNNKLRLPKHRTRKLRLLYLTSEEDEARYLDMDLGKTEEDRDEILQAVHRELSDVWTRINNLVELQDFLAFHHCDREFCFCHKTRPSFVKGTVWERGSSSNL